MRTHRRSTDHRVAEAMLRKLRENSERAKALPALQRWFQRHKLARYPSRSWQESLRALKLTGRQADAAASELNWREEGEGVPAAVNAEEREFLPIKLACCSLACSQPHQLLTRLHCRLLPAELADAGADDNNFALHVRNGELLAADPRTNGARVRRCCRWAAQYIARASALQCIAQASASCLASHICACCYSQRMGWLPTVCSCCTRPVVTTAQKCCLLACARPGFPTPPSPQQEGAPTLPSPLADTSPCYLAIFPHTVRPAPLTSQEEEAPAGAHPHQGAAAAGGTAAGAAGAGWQPARCIRAHCAAGEAVGTWGVVRSLSLQQ